MMTTPMNGGQMHFPRYILCSAQPGYSQPPEMNDEEDVWDKVGAVSSRLASQFTIWVVAAVLIGLFYPPALAWFNKDCVTVALSLSMLCMGLTLSVDDFATIANDPKQVLSGVLLQYTIMPSLGIMLSKLFGLPPAVAVGIVLVSSCPGGVASNIVCFIAKANVALSVAMTTVSTLLAVVLTPLLIKTILGTAVPVSGWALFLSTVQVVLAPVMMGVLLKSLFPTAVDKISKVSPLVGVVAVALIDGGIVAQNISGILSSGVPALLACSGLHGGGFALGYWFPKILGSPEQTSRTTSIEVGMQNSGLGSVLAMQHFADPTIASTCVISACYHSIAGSTLAGWWHGRNEK